MCVYQYKGSRSKRPCRLKKTERVFRPRDGRAAPQPQCRECTRKGCSTCPLPPVRTKRLLGPAQCRHCARKGCLSLLLCRQRARKGCSGLPSPASALEKAAQAARACFSAVTVLNYDVLSGARALKKAASVCSHLYKQMFSVGCAAFARASGR